MKLLILFLAIWTLFALQARITQADEVNSCEWRARSSDIDRDTYSESDTEEEINFGREIAARILGQFKMAGNAKLQKYVNLVGTAVSRNCNRPDLVFHFVVIESSEVNAYSTPGGYVFITTALLEKMGNEAELAGVLAHEIGHVSERHIVKELSLRGTEKSAVSSIAALLGGASKSAEIAFLQAVDKAVELILRDGFKKEDELQADSSAVLLCALSGYDPEGLVTLLDKIGKIKTGVGKTYPVYDVRLATLQKVISDEGISHMKLALNTERFVKAMQVEKGSNPLSIIQKVISGGVHE